MPEWATALLKEALAPTGILALAFGWWFKTKRDDKRAAADRAAAEKKSLEDRIERLQEKIHSLLMDAIAREREHNAQQADRIATDAKQNEVIITATTALKDFAVIAARIERGSI